MNETPREPVKTLPFLLRHFVLFAIGSLLLVAVGGVLSIWLPYQREQQTARRIRSLDAGVGFGYSGPDGIPQSVVDCVPFLMRITYVSGIDEPVELLSELGSLTRLETLVLRNTSVTDAELKHLKGLAFLRVLDLTNTPATDAGLAHFKGLTSLQNLDLENTQVTDAGLEHLKGLTNLGSLDLFGTQVTGPGLANLKGLAHLQFLDLNNTQVTDTGLEHLKGLTTLRQIKLYNTQVTAEGRAMLRKALPSCQIKPSS